MGAMAIKEYFEFPKAPAFLEPLYQIVYYHNRTLMGEYYPYAEMQSVYSTAPADWNVFMYRKNGKICAFLHRKLTNF